ncbi:MAG: hypothetical protein Q9165_001503 [Trypethelium subeluteriae]
MHTTPTSQPIMSNDRPVPDHDTFYTRAKELLVENEAAYKVISRSTPKGQPPPRLAHFRRFWEGMDSLSHYWDTSADEYYVANANGQQVEDIESAEAPAKKLIGDSDIPVLLSSSVPPPPPPRKRTKTGEGDDVSRVGIEGMKTVILDRPAPAASQSPPIIPARSSSTSSEQWTSLSAAPQAQTKSLESETATAMKPYPHLRYRGHRIATGSQVPLSFLSDTIRAFVEACAWPHGCSLTSPRRLPQIQFAASQRPVSKSRTTPAERQSNADPPSASSLSKPAPPHATAHEPAQSSSHAPNDPSTRMDIDTRPSHSSLAFSSTSTSNSTSNSKSTNPASSSPHKKEDPDPHSGKLLLPVRLSALIYRTPADRMRARSGWLEGPLLGLWSRAETGLGKVVWDPAEELSERSREALRGTTGTETETGSSAEGGGAAGDDGSAAAAAVRGGGGEGGSGGGAGDGAGAGGDVVGVTQKEVLDALNEIGALLFLAQERAREGAAARRPGEGQWWTEKPRWGGGEGGEVGNPVGNTDELSGEKGGEEAEEAEKKAAREEGRRQREREKTVALAMEARVARGLGSGREGRRGSEGKGKVSAAEAWKVVKPGLGHWDQKVEFGGIGRREPGSPWDEITRVTDVDLFTQVFLVSSMNRHVSILKLRVHASYIRYITNGEWPDVPPDDEGWDAPLLQRSQWYDLFDQEQRAEAVRGIWGVLTYQMRATSQPDTDMKA